MELLSGPIIRALSRLRQPERQALEELISDGFSVKFSDSDPRVIDRIKRFFEGVEKMHVVQMQIVREELGVNSIFESINYAGERLQFLGTLKNALKADSTNIELHFIHLNLLKKSQQWPKALKKCEKLISLQPQNPRWLFEMSDVFGVMGDSVNAKVYLNLAIKTQKLVTRMRQFGREIGIEEARPVAMNLLKERAQAEQYSEQLLQRKLMSFVLSAFGKKEVKGC